MKLAGKVAIVTGSSRGIGKAIALAFAREGARVVVAARSEIEKEKLPGTIYATAEEIRSLGGQALPVKCSVADQESVEEMVKATLNEWGRVDVLVNNAGIGTYLPLMETSMKLWDLVVSVNLKGPFLCIRAVVPRMIEQGGGSIINVSSTAANTIFSMTVSKTTPGRTLTGPVYGATKAALERLTIGLAAELARYNIAVNAIKPSRPVISEGLRANLPESDWSGWVGPERMARAAVFLAQQDASGVTGTVLTDDEVILQHRLE